jgi:hypothetical protein
MGSLAATQEQITKELRYQSSLDLGAPTYAAIRHLPLARDLVFRCGGGRCVFVCSMCGCVCIRGRVF